MDQRHYNFRTQKTRYITVVSSTHMMNNFHLTWKAKAMKQPGRIKRGRSQLRWEDCVERNVYKAEANDMWNEKAADR